MELTRSSLRNLSWDREADVVVLGFGAAGCAAAIEAHDVSIDVVVPEKMLAGQNGATPAVLSRAVHTNGIEVQLGTPARELVQDGSGAVRGLLATDADDHELRIGVRQGIVLATGGFEADQQNS